MKAEAAAFLDKARECLAKAEDMLARWPDEAGRMSYMAAFHAAQALLLETTGRVFKRHASVQGEFGRHVKDDPRFDGQLRAFLGRSYGLKAMADYETGPDSKVSPELAYQAVETAKRFVAETEKLLHDV
mgnify:CR=1 FL=1